MFWITLRSEQTKQQETLFRAVPSDLNVSDNICGRLIFSFIRNFIFWKIPTLDNVLGSFGIAVSGNTFVTPLFLCITIENCEVFTKKYAYIKRCWIQEPCHILVEAFLAIANDFQPLIITIKSVLSLQSSRIWFCRVAIIFCILCWYDNWNFNNCKCMFNFFRIKYMH